MREIVLQQMQKKHLIMNLYEIMQKEEKDTEREYKADDEWANHLQRLQNPKFK